MLDSGVLFTALFYWCFPERASIFQKFSLTKQRFGQTNTFFALVECAVRRKITLYNYNVLRTCDVCVANINDFLCEYWKVWLKNSPKLKLEFKRSLPDLCQQCIAPKTCNIKIYLYYYENFLWYSDYRRGKFFL